MLPQRSDGWRAAKSYRIGGEAMVIEKCVHVNLPESVTGNEAILEHICV
jgi:hypothetical protein